MGYTGTLASAQLDDPWILVVITGDRVRGSVATDGARGNVGAGGGPGGVCGIGAPDRAGEHVGIGRGPVGFFGTGAPDAAGGNDCIGGGPLILCTRNIPSKGIPSKGEGDGGGGGLFTGSTSGNDNANRLSPVCKTASGKGGGPGGGGGTGSNGGVDVTHGVEDASTLLPLVTKFFLEKPRLT